MIYSGPATGCLDNNGLTPSTTYYYKVQATNAAGSSALSAVAAGTTLSAGPPTPTGLTVSGATSTSLYVSWNASTGATSYQVYRDTSTSGSFATQVYNGTGLNFTDSTLTSGTTYYYKVQATNASGSSALSAAVSGTTSAGPPTPTGLTVSGPTLTSLYVSWNASTGATSYQVYRDTSTGGSFATQVYNGTGLSFTDSTLTSGTTYYYKVQATNASGSSALSAAVSGTTTTVAAPPTPTGLAVPYMNWTSTSLYVSWNASTGATSYQLYRDTSSSGSFTTLVYNSSGTSFTDNPPSAPATYYYKVKATNAGGSSALSAAANGTTIGTIAWQDIGGWDLYFTNDTAKYSTDQIFYNTSSHLTVGGWVKGKVNKLSGWSSGDLGIVYGFIDGNNYRILVVDTNGYWGEFLKLAGAWTTEIGYRTSSYLNTGYDAVNDLQVNYYYLSATGYYYADFYFNGYLLTDYLYSASPFISVTGSTGCYASIGSFSDESFPTIPFAIEFNQYSPISFSVGDAMGAPSAALQGPFLKSQAQAAPGSARVGHEVKIK